MQLAYGSYIHDADEAALSIQRGVNLIDGSPQEIWEEWTIQGQLHANNLAGLLTAQADLEAAYAPNNWGRDLVLYDNSGGVIRSMLSSGSLGGVQIMGPPSFPRSTGGEYTTYLSYTIRARAVYPAPGTGYDTVVTFGESLQFWGGGPRFAMLELTDAPPERQMVNRHTAYHAAQRGRAVGRYSWPDHAVPGPLFPRALVNTNPTIQKGEPQTRHNRLVNFPISWSYEFASAQPLVADPNTRKV